MKLQIWNFLEYRHIPDEKSDIMDQIRKFDQNSEKKRPHALKSAIIS